MATVIAIASLTIEDYLGKRASVPHYIACNSTDTIASLMAAFATLSGLVAPLSAGAVISGYLQIDQPISTGTATSGVPVNVTGGFDFDQAGDPYAFSEVIPCFEPALWTAGPLPAPDPTNTLVEAYVTALTSSNGLGTGFQRD